MDPSKVFFPQNYFTSAESNKWNKQSFFKFTYQNYNMDKFIDKLSKILIPFTWIWVIIVSILGMASIISGTVLQIILSFPIAFIAVIAASKSKSFDVVKYEKDTKTLEDGRKRTIERLFIELYRLIEESYRKENRFDIRKFNFSQHNFNYFEATAYKTNSKGTPTSMIFRLSTEEPDVILEPHSVTEGIDGYALTFYYIHTLNCSDINEYSEWEKRLEFYKSLKKKYMKGLKFKIPKY